MTKKLTNIIMWSLLSLVSLNLAFFCYLIATFIVPYIDIWFF